MSARHPIAEAIYKAYEKRRDEQSRRGHLGGSQIGRTCDREIWLGWRWAFDPNFDGQKLKLFERGHREEPVLIEKLRASGARVLSEKEDGSQFRFAEASLGNHFSGSLDGIACGLTNLPNEWCLLEFKTSNTKAFEKLTAKKVKEAKLEHYVQMQIYMHWADLPRAVYLVVRKDDDELYVEVVERDDDVAQKYIERAKKIIGSPTPPVVNYKNNSKWPCGYCDANELCYENKVADVNCRTCVHSTPLLDGDQDWMCEQTGELLSLESQEKGCVDHLFIPQLVPFGNPIDSGDGWIKYETKSGERKTFLNVAATSFPASDAPHVASRQLKQFQKEEAA